MNTPATGIQAESDASVAVQEFSYDEIKAAMTQNENLLPSACGDDLERLQECRSKGVPREVSGARIV